MVVILFLLLLNMIETAQIIGLSFILLILTQLINYQGRDLTMDITTFMQEVKGAEVEVKLERFPEPFVVKAISERENDRLKKSATDKRRVKGGRIESDFNTDKYTDLLVAQCVVTPDLNNAELQEFYGTHGDPAETLKAMLMAGEYSQIQEQLLDINGFGETDDELVEEVKN